MTIGPNTLPIMGYGLIATAGAVDSHVHLITPKLVPVALPAGVTTLITAGFEEPPMAMDITMRAFEQLPVNLGLQASARTDVPGAVERLVEAGSIGLKIHEDWGAYPEVIDATLRLADAHDVAVCLHTDSLNESAELADTVAAIAGRAVHAYHVEGTGGGHVPDVLALVARAEHRLLVHHAHHPVRDGRRTRARGDDPRGPRGQPRGPGRRGGGERARSGDHDGRRGPAARARRHLDHQQRLAGHGPDRRDGATNVPARARDEDLARLRGGGRLRGSLAGDAPVGAPDASRRADNERVLRYLAKVTAEPALVHGVADEVGSLLPGRLADVVLWAPASFGVKPALVLKAGHFAWGPLGEGNASVEGAEPSVAGPHWAAMGSAPAAVSTTFVSRAALEAGLRERLGSRRRFVAVCGIREVRRSSLVANTAVAPIEIDPGDGTVRLDGRPLTSPPADEVPMSSRYLLG